MLISATLIMKSKKNRICTHCRKEISGKTLRLYGAACKGDPPYVMFLHPECTKDKHPKILEALEKFKQPNPQ